MSYTRTNWVNGGPPAIDATNLLKIEAQLELLSEVVQVPPSTSQPGPQLLHGSGSPEGVVTALIGSLYLRTDGGGVALYAKQTGDGTNTGWAALTGTSPDPFEPPPGPSTGLSPLSQFGFNEGSGTTTTDLLGHGYTMTASNSSTSWTTSNPQSGAASARKEFTSSAIGPNATQDDYTIMFWARREGTFTGLPAMFANSTQEIWIDTGPARNYAPNCYAGDNDAPATTQMAVNTWYHIAVTHTAAGVVQIYVNGLLEGTGTGNTNTLNFGSGGTWVVAGTAATAGTDADWPGTIDSLILFDSVLTRDEIVTWMGEAPSGTVTPPSSGSSWLSGGSGIGPSSGTTSTFGTWRGTPCAIAGTWENDPALYTLSGDLNNWTGAVDVGVVPPDWVSWAHEAAGGHDSFWTAYFTNLAANRAGKGTTYVRMWYEYNGDWMSYSTRNTTDVANFKTAYNRISAIARNKFPAVKIMLGTAAAYKNSITVASTWPTAQVDALSIDYYNQYPWADTQGEFDSNIVNAAGPNSLELLRQLALSKGVPVVISEWANSGIDSGGSGGGESTAFIDAMWDWFNNHKGTGPGQVAAEVYFNLWDKFHLYGINDAPLGAVSSYQPNTANRYVTKF